MNTPATPTPAAPARDFADLVALFDELSAATNSLATLEASLNATHLDNVRLHAETYKELQTRAGQAKAAIEVITARNPQWFEERKTLETPFGSVKRTSATSLSIPDEGVTITLVRAAGRATDFLRETVELNREALEKLGDDELKKLGVVRVTTHNFKPEPASIDLGKAVKAADKSAAGAKKAVKAAKEQ